MAVTADSGALTVIVPAHDEAGTVGDVVAGLLRLLPPPAVLVVDDGSSDGTAAAASAAGARVLRHARRRGNGAALKTGLGAARTELVAVLDADGQHDPACLPALLARLHDGADLAVAARRDFSASGRLRALGHRALAAALGRRLGRALPDLTSGFRAFRRELAEECVDDLPEGFGSPARLLLHALASGRRVDFVDVPARARLAGRTHTRLFRDGAALLWLCLRARRHGPRALARDRASLEGASA